jgi:hypothetical protein
VIISAHGSEKLESLYRASHRRGFTRAAWDHYSVVAQGAGKTADRDMLLRESPDNDIYVESTADRAGWRGDNTPTKNFNKIRHFF